ncbi:hypothetical protein C882_0188 [Caenispirillum salinarum AK4]|uniref:2-amino-4-ketopentanoate thiolase, alpha subunit n=1 Tax=Caenispirillum salinarum AK4 TaxID=1238182 RepID=K9HH59_9PROT|nr:2-amino-4-oxopentanoate thiolase subunit OrtA [Caenispirillum salinarum]EKV29758.1 hypothetical protein C882_0188 [Caenispirillum salinarum AK4]
MTDTATRGEWVRIHWLVLEAGDRAPNLPDDTRAVPLEARAKGFLLDGTARIGDRVCIRTLIGRDLEGRMEAINPEFGHDFGRAVPELLAVGPELRRILQESPR